MAPPPPPRNNGASLLFSIEQWELIRRLRNSGLTKEQIGQAFDDLNKIEQDLGSMYNLPLIQNNSNIPSQINNALPGNTDTKFASNQILSNMQIFQMAKNLTSMAQTTRPVVNNSSNNSNSNGISYSNGSRHHQHEASSIKSEQSEYFSNNNSQTTQNSSNNQSTAAVSIVNSHFGGMMDSDMEAKQIEEFKLKGEVVIHGEISFFVYKHDLKQSQIARMAGVNQAYVSKFLRGEFFDLSENGKSLIYKWYLRYLKNSAIFHQAHNISVNPNVVTTTTTTTNGHQLHDKSIVNIKTEHIVQPASFASFNNVTNTTSYETPKRSRFSFKSEHLIILEKAFVENHYPDQKRREELSKQCNELKTGSERVTEQIITHWFQNKRKITRKLTMDDRASISPNDDGGLSGTNCQSANGDYGNEDNLSYQEGEQQQQGNVNDNSDFSNCNESPDCDYQDFVDEDNELYKKNSISSGNSKNRHVSTDSVDY